MSGAGSFLSGLAGGYRMGEDLQYKKKMRGILDEFGEKAGKSGGGSAAPAAKASVTGAKVNAGKVAADATGLGDPQNDMLSPHARAFLNSIALGESGGKYNVRYTPGGGAEFDASTNQHPRIYEKGPHGPSSAAGRYQFTAQTWDELGGGDFSPKRQDEMAWKLAQQRYQKYTGGDLDAELRAGGATPEMFRALSPTWAAFKGDPTRYVDTYNNSMSRYNSPPITERPSVRSVLNTADTILGKFKS